MVLYFHIFSMFPNNSCFYIFTCSRRGGRVNIVYLKPVFCSSTWASDVLLVVTYCLAALY